MRRNLTTAGSSALDDVVAPPALVRWADRLIVAALLLAPLLVFWAPALLRGVFYIHDVQYYFYPYHALSAQLAARGELPLWNPYAFSGIPLLGDGQTAMFYPPNWLFFVLPAGAALNYDVLLQFSIAGAGMFVFARGLGLWRVPALLGAIAYMFCGFMTARVVHLSILSGAALIPLVFLCVDRALRGGGRRWFAAAAGAVALQALAGHPQVPVYTALALGLYALVRATERGWAEQDWHALYRLPLRLAGVYLLGYGLAAIQLAPWVELGSFSPRAAGASFDFVFGGSMVGSHWLLWIFPYLYGSLDPGIYAEHALDIASAVKLWEHSGYVGILPLALAAYALLGLAEGRGLRTEGREDVRRQSPVTSPPSSVLRPPSWFTVCFFALLLLGSLILAAGRTTPFARLIYLMPVVGKLRDVERGLALADFALASLAAFGLQRVLYQKRRIGLLPIAIATACLPLALIFLVQQPAFRQRVSLQPHELDLLEFGRANAVVPAALALVCAALLIWLSQRRPGLIGQALVVGLVALDLGAYAALFNPTTDPQLYTRRPDVLAAFEADSAPFRKATWLTSNDLDNRTAQETLAVSWSMAYGVEDINGFNSLQPRRYTDFLFGPAIADVSYGYLNDPRLLRAESPILSALGVKYLLIPSHLKPELGAHFRLVYENAQVRVYENRLAYPRAFFAGTVRGETDPRAVLSAVTADGFDGRRLALVEAAEPPAVGAAADADAATVRQHDANRVVIDTDSASQRLLVLGDIYFPGWQAHIDGAATPIYRTNYLFRGVAVPAGHHTVTFEYRPTSALIGVAISALALAVAGWLALSRR